MQKYRDADIKSFEFSDLKGNHVVSQPAQYQAFSFKDITSEPFNTQKASEETLRTERSFENKTSFKIDGIVRDYRGLSRQEQSDLEKKIQEEVDRRLEVAYKEAFQEGLEKGKEEGREEAYLQYQEVLTAKVENLAQIVESAHTQSVGVIERNRAEVYEFVKRFTKWIVFKEINEKVYLENLLEKLILELNARKNIIIKVGKAQFADMPEVIKAVESRLGQLSNVRVEIVSDIKYPGIILEAENGLIDGSLEGVFQNIDKIFEHVNGSGSST